MRKHRALAAGLFAPLLLFARVPAAAETPDASAAPVLTLSEALALAKTNNRTIASADLEVGKATDRLGALKAQRYPNLSVDATAARTLNTLEFRVDEGTFGTFPATGPIPAANTTITTPPKWTALGLASVKQPLSQLYKLGLGVKSSERLVDSAKEDLRQGRQSVAHEVRKAYYAIASADSTLAAARESLLLAREVARVVGERVVVAAAFAHDEVDARASLAQAEYAVASGETSLAAAKQQLNALLGRDVDVDFRIDALAAPTPVSQDEAEAASRALEQRPDVRRARLNTAVAELDARRAKAEYLPDITLTASYFSPWQIEFQTKGGIWSAGVLIQWELFDGGRRSKELAEKRKTAQQARLAVADAEAAARIASRHDWRRLRDAERLVKASELARDATRDRLRVVKVRYESQASLAQDLFKAQADLAEAHHNWNQALASYWAARADYESSIGEDL